MALNPPVPQPQEIITSPTGPMIGELSGVTSTAPAQCRSIRRCESDGAISSSPAITASITGGLPRWVKPGTLSKAPPKTISPLSDWLKLVPVLGLKATVSKMGLTGSDTKACSV